MYHKMDRDYDIIGINEVLEIGDYRTDGYTKNILKTFKDSPLGYYMYFKEILEKDFAGVSFNKRMYVCKHFILFTNLAEQNLRISDVNGLFNKFLILILWIPGTIMTKKKFKTESRE